MKTILKVVNKYRHIPRAMMKSWAFLFFIFFTFIGNTKAQADVTTGLVGWWLFDDVSGNSAQDSSSGNINTATLYNNPTWTKGILNEGALSFNGTNNYLTANTTNFPQNEQPLTVSAWVYLSTTPSSDSTIVYQGEVYAGATYSIFQLSLSGANHNVPVFSSQLSCAGGTNWQAVSPTPLTPGQWYNIVGVSSGACGMSISINGVTTAGNYINFSGYGGTSFPISIGAKIDSSSSGFFNGLIDDVRVYNRAFTQSDATELYAQGTSTPSATENLSIIKLGIGQGTITGQGIDCSLTCSQALTPGTNLTLTATPSSGFQFVGWSGGGCSGTGTCTTTINQDTTVTALFIPTGPSVVNNFYISQNGTGNGTSCANAQSAAWFNTPANWGTYLGQIGPGATVLLCGNIATGLTVQGSGTSVNPITILFSPGAEMSQASWSGNIINIPGQSWIVIDGGATGKIGGYNGNPALANGIIESTDNGTGTANGGTKDYQNNATGVYGFQSTHIIVKNLVIRNLYVNVSGTDSNGGSTAVSTGNSVNTDWLVDNCIFHDMTTGFSIIYGAGDQNFTYSNTTAYNVNWGGNAGDSSSSSTIANLVVKNNYFHDFGNWDQTDDNYHHNGFYAWAESGGTLNDVTYANNVVANFGVNQTSGFFISGAGAVGPYNIFNNLFIETGNGQPPANGDVTVGAGAGSHTRVYNNTVIGAGWGGAVYLAAGTGVTKYADVENNIIISKTAIEGENVAGIVLTSNNNLFYNLAAGGEAFSWSSTDTGNFLSFADWQAEGLDINSINANPNLNGGYGLLSSSPAIGAGANFTSLGITALDSDAAGNARPSTGAWDIGAYAYLPANSSVNYGDVNGDGQVTIYDAELTAQYAVGLPVANFNTAAAEVDSNSTVDIYDAFLIAEYAVGLITKFPVQGGS